MGRSYRGCCCQGGRRPLPRHPAPAFCCILSVFCPVMNTHIEALQSWCATEDGAGSSRYPSMQSTASHLEERVGRGSRSYPELARGLLCRTDYFISPMKRAGTGREAGLSISPVANHLPLAARSCCTTPHPPGLLASTQHTTQQEFAFHGPETLQNITADS